MAKIDLTVYTDRLERAVKRARERNIIIPTFAQQKDPTLVPAKIKEELKGIGLWDCTSAQSVPHYLEKRAGRQGRRVRQGQLLGAA